MVKNKQLIVIILFSLTVTLAFITLAIVIAFGIYHLLTPNQVSIKPCTQDAKLCPDGSAVGRIGSNCEFAACPGPIDISNWVTYTDEETGYGIKLPPDWARFAQNAYASQESAQKIYAYKRIPPSPYGHESWVYVEKGICSNSSADFQIDENPAPGFGIPSILEKTVCYDGFRITLGLFASDPEKEYHKKILETIAQTIQQLSDLYVSDLSTWRTDRDEKYGFEFKHPADWVAQKRSVTELNIYWDGKLNGIPYAMTLGYLSQDDLNTMGITYCRAHPEDTRCENFKWGNLVATIDWNIETEGAFTKSMAEIQHPNGGVVIISIYHRPAQDIKSFFRQILSTFKFIK